MASLSQRLERRLGKYAIDNLSNYIVGGMGVVFILSLSNPMFSQALTFDLAQIAHGQAWRLITYLFIPPSTSVLWIVFSLYWTWLVGSSLESHWGAFRFNVYYLIGMVTTTLAASIAGGAVGNSYLNLSLFFAFATLFPDYQILLFFVLPVRVKWVAWVSAAYLGYELLLGGFSTRAAIAAALTNYGIFFGGHFWLLAKQRRRSASPLASSLSRSVRPVASEARTCSLCGAREDEGADIRVCVCQKCGKPTQFCLPHARNH